MTLVLSAQVKAVPLGSVRLRLPSIDAATLDVAEPWSCPPNRLPPGGVGHVSERPSPGGLRVERLQRDAARFRYRVLRCLCRGPGQRVEQSLQLALVALQVARGGTERRRSGSCATRTSSVLRLLGRRRCAAGALGKARSGAARDQQDRGILRRHGLGGPLGRGARRRCAARRSARLPAPWGSGPECAVPRRGAAEAAGLAGSGRAGISSLRGSAVAAAGLSLTRIGFAVVGLLAAGGEALDRERRDRDERQRQQADREQALAPRRRCAAAARRSECRLSPGSGEMVLPSALAAALPGDAPDRLAMGLLFAHGGVPPGCRVAEAQARRPSAAAGRPAPWCHPSAARRPDRRPRSTRRRRRSRRAASVGG